MLICWLFFLFDQFFREGWFRKVLHHYLKVDLVLEFLVKLDYVLIVHLKKDLVLFWAKSSLWSWGEFWGLIWLRKVVWGRLIFSFIGQFLGCLCKVLYFSKRCDLFSVERNQGALREAVFFSCWIVWLKGIFSIFLFQLNKLWFKF